MLANKSIRSFNDFYNLFLVFWFLTSFYNKDKFTKNNI
ncbi:hypothetical protein MMSYN1_0135 [synthetic Mycoplasma mycoides JCVI-syn1.0]|nr:hypothetical protein MMCAP2_0135 [Mycoplasma mycoides subsp. capri str. GM12]ACU79129.1 hypothetical protein MMCAP1_0135 [Mycoplasma mycoides subsp. capri str. GM12]ADH21638.1 hypothetical protein MMSYN1_0135 [synthetic Mycoplasma mycoides JCVI-syn1.0]